MLTALSIENIVLIKKLDLAFQGGLTVLTGETGAGKSILLDALNCVTGERADVQLIRAQAQEAWVTACFTIQEESPAYQTLKAMGLPVDTQLILRRFISRSAPSKAFINDHPVAVKTLKTVGEQVLHIHGQFDPMLTPEAHRSFLDLFGEHEALLQDVSNTYDAWKKEEMELAEAEKNSQSRAQRLAFLDMAIQELSALDPKPGEEERLNQEREVARHYTKLQELTRGIYQTLYEGQGVESHMAEALKLLDQAQGLSSDFFHDLKVFLDNAYRELQEFSPNVESFCASTSDHDLDAIEDRLMDLRTVSQRYGVTVEELQNLLAQFLQESEALGSLSASMDELKTKVAMARDAYEKTAHDLRGWREKTAKHLEGLLHEKLGDLKLAEARVHFALTLLPVHQWGREGQDMVQLIVQMNPGGSPGPLEKVASGGERSRLMLALKAVLLRKNPHAVHIFDEIDTGMSGATSSSVGSVLKELSQVTQVLAITHAPQVACKADEHWFVEKSGDDQGLCTTHVYALDQDKRVRETARLLSGDTITPEAETAALSLLRSCA